MYVSLNWLKDFVKIEKDPKDLATLLTLKTAEVDSVINQGEKLNGIVVGQIISLHKHPNADTLTVTKTSIGKETIQVICGGQNLKEGMYVAVATIGTKVDWHGEGKTVTIERTKIRGEESEGMICAGSEIGIHDPNEQPKHILDLSALKPKPGTPLAELLEKNDIILEFDNKSLTHRPDLWGHYGIAREIAAITGEKLKPYETKVQIPTKGTSPKVEIEDENLCPRYCGLTIENVDVTDSPDWLKKRLEAIGHGTHNNIVDVTNYVMAELGQPMHAFDADEIETGIIVRRAKDKEKITTLDDKQYTLTKDMLVIADHKKPLAIAGVIGGKHSGISEKTSTIILESANFNSTSVRRTSTKLNVRTDAVQRFEKAVDPNLAEIAIKRAAELILQICPKAKISGPITDKQSFDKKPLKLKLDTNKTRSKIGVAIENKEIKQIFESLQFQVKENGQNFEITVPTFRATKDVTTEDDLIEEVARIYGYDNIETSLPTLPTKLPAENIERFRKHRARELFSYGLGMDEVYNYSFYGKAELQRCLMTEDHHLKLLNYLSEDQTHMRTSMTPNLLKNVQQNAKYKDHFKIYEIGHTYKEIGQFYPLEEKKIAGAIMKKGKTDEIFYEAKGAVEAFLKKFKIETLGQAKGIKATPYAHPNKSLTYIDQEGQTIAKVFMLHPQVVKNHDLEKFSIAIFAINFTEALKLTNEEHKYQPIPKFPSTQFDVSVLIDKTKEVGEIHKAIEKSSPELITEIKLFDIYEGQNIEPDKKAVAFSITMQAQDRTLNEEEMTTTQNKVFKNIEALGGKIRGR